MKIIKVIIAMLLLAKFVMAAEHKVVFSLTTPDVDLLESKLINQVKLLNKHYKKNKDTFKVAVVIYGDSYNFFLKKSQHKLRDKLKNLHENYNVSFDMCGMGMKKRGIKTDMIYEFVNPAFNKNTALIKWQNKGYAHIKVE
jgi:intracellular sulfur oxidation DsrE/DsrF family protein